MKKILASLLAVILILSLAACGSSGNNIQNTEINANTNEPSNTVQPENTTPSNPTEFSVDKGNEATGNSILVVYFSWSGHLDSMAHWVADETGGDLYRVTAKDPFLRTHFVFLDDSEPLIFFFIDYLAIMGLFVFIGHYLAGWLKRLDKKGSHK